MKKLVLLFSLILLISAKNEKSINIGDTAPLSTLEMEGIEGEMHSLNSVNSENGLLVIFTCNTCPYVLAWEDTYPELKKLADKNNIGMILVNSNEAKRGNEDSKEEMISKATSGDYKMPYVIDKNSELANAFGANTTPHVYLFDGNLKLSYKGAIDDKYESKEKVAKNHYLMEALKAQGSNETIKPNTTQNRGCSIKRV